MLLVLGIAGGIDEQDEVLIGNDEGVGIEGSEDKGFYFQHS